MSRRSAREDALQILFQLDLNEAITPLAGIQYFSEHFTDKQIDPFTRRLVEGVKDSLPEIDGWLARTSENWKPERMASVDRNLLRMGVYELLWCDDVPATVTIDEMIELAKDFGSENSGAFLNGVLDKIRIHSPRPEKVP